MVALRALLAPEVEVATWFEPFKIHTDEYAEILNPYLIANTQSGALYTHLIQAQWDTICSQVNASQLTEFYSAIVQNYSRKAGHTTLANKACIYVASEGFVHAEAVFYHPKLKISNH